MKKYFYSLSNNQILYDNITLNKVILDNDAELIVEFNLNDTNIISKLNELQQKINGKISIDMVAVKHNKDYITDEAQISKLVKIDNYLKKN